MSAGPDLAIVITTYDVRDLLLRCLDALKKATGSLRVEVVVIDNGFQDDSWQSLVKRGDVRAVRGSSDLGFGGANNIGAQVTQAPIIFRRGLKLHCLNIVTNSHDTSSRTFTIERQVQ